MRGLVDILLAILIGLVIVAGIFVVPVIIALLTPIVIILAIILAVWFFIKIAREEPTHRDPD
jgi:hypothetical protein